MITPIMITIITMHATATRTITHHHHDHDDHASAWGHAHAPEPEELAGPGGWKRGLSAIVAVGLRPCSGAILVLVFALAQGLFWAGVVATFVMGLGTAITVAAIATIAVGAKAWAKRFADTRSGYGMLAMRGIEVGAAVVIIAFGVAAAHRLHGERADGRNLARGSPLVALSTISRSADREGRTNGSRTTLDPLLHRRRRPVRADARLPAGARRRRRRRAREACRFPARLSRRHHPSLDPRHHGRARPARRVPEAAAPQGGHAQRISSAATNTPSRISRSCRPAASSSR